MPSAVPGPGMAPALYRTRTDPRCRTLGPAARRVAHALGIDLMPWQGDALDLALALDPDSPTGFRYTTVIVTTPRRAGKTTTVTVATTHRALAFPKSSSFYTAQTGQDARDYFREVVSTVGLSPLKPLTLAPRMAAGSEALRWANGSTFRPFSPQPDALHGKDTDLAVIDEGWSFGVTRATQLLQAVSPTQLTRPWRQLWFPSTAGDVTSEWFRSLVMRGRASIDDPESRTAFIEYGCPDDLDPLAPESWPLFHPAFGLTVTEDALRGELDRMGPDEFARAYGNRWPDLTSAGDWPDGSWAAAADLEAAPAGDLSWGVDIATDRRHASIAVASSGPVVEMVESSRPGLAWIAARVTELVNAHGGKVTVNPAGPGATLPYELANLGERVRQVDGAEYAAACAHLFDRVVDGSARIRPNAALDAAQASAGRRRLGDRWAWDRRTSIDISPLTAATLATAGVTGILTSSTMPAPAWYVPA